ncbi:MAG: xylulokinase [Brucellaceae bacterium]|nr:xylulokinase [Brucellaceae bacterium]
MYAGIDLGTSSVKVLLIGADQGIVASASSPLTVERPHAGWSEQDPAAWISATEAAFDALKRDHGKALAAVKGIGLSGQMHGATLVDEAGKALRPCILWNDVRSHKEARALDSDPAFRRISGNIVFPGFTAPKLVWVKENEPEHFDKTAKVLLPKDYLRLWLTGDYISEMSDSAGTSWLDTAARAWSDTLLEASGMRAEQMPALVEGSEPGGELRGELAARWGMDGPVVVAGGGGDNAASAIGMGVVHAGSAFVSIGTSGVLFAANDAYLPNPQSAVHTFCHALPGKWHQMGVILSATDALNWYCGVIGEDAAALTGQMGEGLRAPANVTFLPYLSGERTPHNDAAIRGAFIGLEHETSRDVLTQSVLEGVAYAFRDSQEALRAAGTELQRVLAVGGGSQSLYWLRLIATVLDIPVDVPADGEFGAAFGAARLGLLAAEGGDPGDVCTLPLVESVIEPEVALREAFSEGYARYRALYPAIAGAGS